MPFFDVNYIVQTAQGGVIRLTGSATKESPCANALTVRFSNWTTGIINRSREGFWGTLLTSWTGASLSDRSDRGNPTREYNQYRARAVISKAARSLYCGEIVDHNLGNLLIVIVRGHDDQPVLHCGRGYPNVIGGYRGASLPQPVEDDRVSLSRFFGDV